MLFFYNRYSTPFGTKAITNVFLAILLGSISLTACSDKGYPESDVYTLYSTEFPTGWGRVPIATFDVASMHELNQPMCQEAADLYQADFEKSKIQNIGVDPWKNAKARHWCEKGRYKK